MFSTPNSWHDLILNPKNASQLGALLESFQPNILVNYFRRSFTNPHDPKAFQLIGKPLKAARAEDIIASVEMLHEKHFDFLELAVSLWLVAFKEGDQAFIRFSQSQFHAVLAWLNTQAPMSENPDWSYLKDLAEQLGEAQKLAKKQEAELTLLERESRKVKQQADEILRLKTINQSYLEQLQEIQKESADDKANQESKVLAFQRSIKKLKNGIQQRDDLHSKAVIELETKIKEFEVLLEKQAQELSESNTLASRQLETNTKLTEAVKKSNRENEKLSEEVLQLKNELENTLNTNALRLPNEAQLENSLIVDYAALGETAYSRFNTLLSIFEAFQEKKNSSVLVEFTNWSDLAEETEAFILIGLKLCLKDCLELPLRRYMQLSNFKHESLLSSLSKQLKRVA